MTDQQAVERFNAAVDTWLATYDAMLADLVARHEQHKVQLAKAGRSNPNFNASLLEKSRG